MSKADAWYELCKLVPRLLRSDLSRYLDGLPPSPDLTIYLKGNESLRIGCDNFFQRYGKMSKIRYRLIMECRIRPALGQFHREIFYLTIDTEEDQITQDLIFAEWQKRFGKDWESNHGGLKSYELTHAETPTDPRYWS